MFTLLGFFLPRLNTIQYVKSPVELREGVILTPWTQDREAQSAGEAQCFAAFLITEAFKLLHRTLTMF